MLLSIYNEYIKPKKKELHINFPRWRVEGDSWAMSRGFTEWWMHSSKSCLVLSSSILTFPILSGFVSNVLFCLYLVVPYFVSNVLSWLYLILSYLVSNVLFYLHLLSLSCHVLFCLVLSQMSCFIFILSCPIRSYFVSNVLFCLYPFLYYFVWFCLKYPVCLFLSNLIFVCLVYSRSFISSLYLILSYTFTFIFYVPFCLVYFPSLFWIILRP